MTQPAQRPAARFTGYWIAIAAGIALLAWLSRRVPVQDLLARALDHVTRLGAWAPIAFIALYIAATVLMLPGSLLTLGAGAAFGIVRGSIYVSIASTLGATAAFLVSRHLLRNRLVARFHSDARFEAIDRAVALEGWKIVGLTRLSPILPFNLLNYALGLTRVPLPHYIVASWIGMLPGTILFVYIGAVARDATLERNRSSAEWALYIVGLAATAVATLLVTRIARQALARRLN